MGRSPSLASPSAQPSPTGQSPGRKDALPVSPCRGSASLGSVRTHTAASHSPRPRDSNPISNTRSSPRTHRGRQRHLDTPAPQPALWSVWDVLAKRPSQWPPEADYSLWAQLELLRRLPALEVGRQPPVSCYLPTPAARSQLSLEMLNRPLVGRSKGHLQEAPHCLEQAQVQSCPSAHSPPGGPQAFPNSPPCQGCLSTPTSYSHFPF